MITHSLVEDPLCHTDVSKEKQFCKRILIVDDEADVTITFKAGSAIEHTRGISHTSIVAEFSVELIFSYTLISSKRAFA
jgi:hypothetical protein